MLKLLAVSFLIGFVQSIEIGEDIKFDLQLIKHHPCVHTTGKSQWTKKLEFEEGNGKTGPKLEVIEGKPGCYSIGGHVKVLQEFPGNFSIYLEIRHTAGQKRLPESCAKQGDDGCGGIGSCLYCDACSTFENDHTVKAQLLLNGKSIQCTEGLRPGTYDDLKLVFCVPNVDEVLAAHGLTRSTLHTLVGSDKSSHSIGLFATAYIFDTDVKKQMLAQKKVVSVYKDTKKTFFKDEALPAEVYWNLPFNSLIKKQTDYVACHKIYGNIKINFD